MQALWMLAGSLAFSVMGATIKLLMASDYGAFELVFWRGLCGIALTAAFMRAYGISPASGRFGMHASRSVLGTLAMFGWFYTLGPLPLGTAFTLNYSSPLFIAIAVAAAAWWRGSARRTPARLYLALASGFVGVLMILKPSIGQGQEIAVLIGLAAAVLTAAAYLQVRFLGRAGEPEWRTVFWFSVVNCALAALAATAFDGWHPVALRDVPALLAIGALAAIGQLCMTRAFGRGRTLLAANLQYSGVVFATIIGWLAFGESHDVIELSGILLIVASGIAATLVPQPALPESPAAAARREPASKPLEEPTR